MAGPPGPEPRPHAWSHLLVDFDRERFSAADRQRVVAEPELERIAERRDARHADLRAGHEAELHEAAGDWAHRPDAPDDGFGAERQSGKRTGSHGHGLILKMRLDLKTDPNSDQSGRSIGARGPAAARRRARSARTR